MQSIKEQLFIAFSNTFTDTNIYFYSGVCLNQNHGTSQREKQCMIGDLPSLHNHSWHHLVCLCFVFCCLRANQQSSTNEVTLQDCWFIIWVHNNWWQIKKQSQMPIWWGILHFGSQHDRQRQPMFCPQFTMCWCPYRRCKYWLFSFWVCQGDTLYDTRMYTKGIDLCLISYAYEA